MPGSARGGGPQQIANPDQVVGGGPQAEHPVDHGGTPIVDLPELRDRLQPAEDLLHPLPAALTHGVPGVAGGPTVDGAPAVRIDVLSPMRGESQVSATREEVRGVVALVAAENRGGGRDQSRRFFQ